MSLVVITIQDTVDGVAVNVTAEPPIAPGRAALSNAEKLGVIALDTIHKVIEQTEMAGPPKLVIVGADRLPKKH